MLDVKPTDKNIWFYHLIVSFPFALNKETESMMDEFIINNYKDQIPSEEWINQLLDCDERGNEKENWEGTSVNIRINDKVVFYAEFHPYETIFFLNDTYIGNTGGHWKLSLLRWEEFMKMAANSDYLFWLMLPLVIGNADAIPEIKAEIAKRFYVLPLKEDDLQTITNFLLSHLIFKNEGDVFSENPQAGTVCSRNHSCRNMNNHSLEEIKQVNDLIKLAME